MDNYLKTIIVIILKNYLGGKMLFLFVITFLLCTLLGFNIGYNQCRKDAINAMKLHAEIRSCESTALWLEKSLDN